MGSRDHSWECTWDCTVCGETRGGLDDLRCDCSLRTLAANLTGAAALCRAFELGRNRACWEYDYNSPDRAPWRPGCGRGAP
jgi:hypothetical protein